MKIFRIKHIAFLSGLMICLLQNSCFTLKYTTSGASIPVEAKTVSVQFFENQAPIVSPSLSFQITDALKDYVQSNTKLILINGTGDLDFEGVITGYDEAPTAITGGDIQVARKRFTITVKVKYTNSFNTEQDWETSFSRFEEYDGNLSFDQAQSRFTESIINLLIEDIFNRAFVNW